MVDIVVKPVLFDDSNLSGLISQLDTELLAIYPAEAIFGVDFNDPSIHEIVFVVAYCDGIAVGCGAFRPLDRTSVELKRFFVAPTYRKRGVASKILAFLEGEARDREYSTFRLETGLLLSEAVALYKKFGYDEIQRYGVYVGCEQSICFAKELNL